MSTSDSGSGIDRDVAKRVVVLVVLVLVLVFYFLLLGRIAIGLLASGDAAAIGLGIGVLILPLLGVWMVVATVRAALSHQRLARRMHEQDRELDTSQLPRRPSGRIEREAADELFRGVEAEWQSEPDSWQVNFRLARAYDYAGDRARARSTMRRAVELEKREHQHD